MKTRKKIGFVFNGQEVETIVNSPSAVETSKEICEVPVSPVQMQLINSIANLSKLITSPDFAKMNQTNKDNFVMQLISNVELNAELNILKQYALDR